MNWQLMRGPLFLLAGVLVIGVLGLFFGGTITVKAEWEADFWPRLQAMLIVAVLIERAVEVYLKARDLNGPDRFIARTVDGKDATVPATTTGIVLGLLVAFAGLRLLDTVGVPSDSSNKIAGLLWFGVDVVVSGGLMAGGAALFHEVAEALRGGLQRMGNSFAQTPPEARTMAVIPATSTYSIDVKRTSKDQGRLVFEAGSVRVDTDCWWAADKKIAGGIYGDCSKTRMATKKDSVTNENRPAIFLPSAVAPDTGSNSIFIHEGNDPSWSDGCIVLQRAQMMRIWNAISPENARNVTVTIHDA